MDGMAYLSQPVLAHLVDFLMINCKYIAIVPWILRAMVPVFFVGNKNNIFPPWNQHSTWKWMVGIRSFPFGAQPIFRGELLVPKRECSWWWFGLHLLGSPLGKFIQFDEHIFLGGGFKYFLFSPLFGETIQFDSYFFIRVETTKQFRNGLVQPPT